MDLNAERGGPRGRHTESVFNKLHFCSVSLQPARIDDNDDAEAAMCAHTQREEKNIPSIYHRFPMQCIRCVSPLQPLTLPLLLSILGLTSLDWLQPTTNPRRFDCIVSDPLFMGLCN